MLAQGWKSVRKTQGSDASGLVLKRVRVSLYFKDPQNQEELISKNLTPSAASRPGPDHEHVDHPNIGSVMERALLKL